MLEVDEVPDEALRPAVVIGTGPAGLAAALAMAAEGVPTTLLGPAVDDDTAERDTRTTALFGGSLDFLRNIGATEILAREATPLAGLRLIDDTGALLRAPEVLFEASEIGLPAFGMNVKNGRLLRELAGLVRAEPTIRWLEGARVERITAGGPSVRIDGEGWDGGVLEARLVVGADGRSSKSRAAAGSTTKAWALPQSAIAVTFRHARPHGNISTEFHRRAGPLTVVPLQGRSSSLVWVEDPEEARRLGGLADDAFLRVLEDRLQGLLGGLSELGARAIFPLSGLVAEPLAARRIALVGEAGHVMPPIGAQGLNLGFRDAAWIADLAGAAHRSGRDPGGADVLDAYHAERHGDVTRRSLAVDLLNRSLLANFLPLDMARGGGIALMEHMGWLRHLVMREGMEPQGPKPRLMREHLQESR